MKQIDSSMLSMAQALEREQEMMQETERYLEEKQTAVPLDCRSEAGITVGLVDALIAISRILSKRELTGNVHVTEALKDLAFDTDLCFILATAEKAFDDEKRP